MRFTPSPLAGEGWGEGGSDCRVTPSANPTYEGFVFFRHPRPDRGSRVFSCFVREEKDTGFPDIAWIPD